jgi:hypothetical protein
MSKSNKFDEMFNSVCEFMMKNGATKDPRIAIYIEISYFHQMASEFNSEMTSVAYDFLERRTVRGYPIFIVSDHYSEMIEHKHAPWEVVLLGGKPTPYNADYVVNEK